MVHKLEDRDWTLLLERIRDGNCTPVLGDGTHPATLQRYSSIARRWADECEFPIQGAEEDLVRVAQYATVYYRDESYAKERLSKELEALPALDYSAADNPYGALADLPLPVYLTTSYCNYMAQALIERKKDPRIDVCHWDAKVTAYPPPVFEGASLFDPTPANPVVYHFHGLAKYAESMVLTEDDYIDFLVNVSKDETLIPGRIHKAIANTSLLILGYSPSDWSLRVIFQGIIRAKVNKRMSRISVTVQLPPVSDDPDDPRQQNLQKYFDDYFGGFAIRAYWGTTREFATELRQRWKEYDHGN